MQKQIWQNFAVFFTSYLVIYLRIFFVKIDLSFLHITWFLFNSDFLNINISSTIQISGWKYVFLNRNTKRLLQLKYKRYDYIIKQNEPKIKYKALTIFVVLCKMI